MNSIMSGMEKEVLSDLPDCLYSDCKTGQIVYSQLPKLSLKAI